jgi:hypothetical protein
MTTKRPEPLSQERLRADAKDCAELIRRAVAKVRHKNFQDEYGQPTDYCAGCGEDWNSEDHDCIYRLAERASAALVAMAAREGQPSSDHRASTLSSGSARFDGVNPLETAAFTPSGDEPGRTTPAPVAAARIETVDYLVTAFNEKYGRYGGDIGVVEVEAWLVSRPIHDAFFKVAPPAPDALVARLRIASDFYRTNDEPDAALLLAEAADALSGEGTR